MSNHQSLIRRLGIVLLLLGLLLFPSNSFAQPICLDDATASRLVVTLEQAKIMESQLAIQAGSNAELQNQLEILRMTIKLYDEQIAAYKSMIEMNRQMSDVKDKACAEQIKVATPTFLEKVKNNFFVGGVGVIIGGVIVALFL